MTAHRSAHNPLGAVEWHLEELELDGAPFGGVRVTTPAASHSDPAPIVQQQALDEAFSQGFDAGRGCADAHSTVRDESRALVWL